MRNLSTTVAVYADMPSASGDWERIEHAGEAGTIDLADAALVTYDNETVTALERQSHHGWGKGAVAGSVVGILFPPALLGSALVGAIGGCVVARLTRSLDRCDIKEMGEVMDDGQIAIVVITTQETSGGVPALIGGAKRWVTKDGATAEEVMAALLADKQPAAS